MFMPHISMASTALDRVHGTQRSVIRCPEAIWRQWHSDDKRFNYYTIPTPPFCGHRSKWQRLLVSDNQTGMALIRSPDDPKKISASSL